MTTATEQRAVVVVLEPNNRAELDTEKEALIRDCDPRLQTDIHTPDEYAAIADIEARISKYIAAVEPAFNEHCSAAYKVWKSACNIRERFLAAPKLMKERARRLLSEYKTREETERREREQAIARQAFEAATERARNEAAFLDSQKQPELAAAVRNAPIEAPTVTLPSAVPQVDGLTYREDWYWIPVGGDTPANRARAVIYLVKQERADLLALDDRALTAFAKHNKDAIKITGILFRSRQVPVRRS